MNMKALLPNMDLLPAGLSGTTKTKKNTSVIRKHYEQLHSNYIFLGLNISGPLSGPPWCNFRNGKHDRKLKYACNDTELRGSYITDIFKYIEEPNSANLRTILTPEIIRENVDLFNQEMKDIGLKNESQFIVLGSPSSLLAQCFNDYFKQGYKNPIIYYYHYAYYRLTDKEWVTGIWKKLNLTHDFDLTLEKYRHN